MGHHFLFESCEPRRLLSVNVIDLLALYTPGAAVAHGGAANTQSLIQQAVDSTNAALARSLISITIRLVHVEQIAYVGSGDLFLDRTRLQTPGDGFLDSVHALRNTWGADLVHMVTENAPGAGGNAALLNNLAAPDNDTRAFSVMDHTSLQPWNLTLAHELGHNIGAGHERGNPDGAVGPFAYSYGYRFVAAGVQHHDIMAYQYPPFPDVEVPYYANPLVSFDGVPTGVPAGQPNEADLALTFAQTGPVVAAYRATAVPDTVGPLATIYEKNPAGNMFAFTIRYRDDSAVDVSTIGDNDVYVVTPEGFQLAAELISISGGPGGNGWQKLVKYRVTLPASNPPVASLGIALRANAVKDAGGNFSPAGTLALAAGVDDAGREFPAARDLGTPTTSIVSDFVNEEDTDDFYKLTVAAPATLNVSLWDLTDDANAQIIRDVNGNGIFDGGAELIKGSFNPSGGDRAAAANLTVSGTYFVKVYRQGFGDATNYTMKLDLYADAIAPTARLDATDVKINGSPFADFAVDYSDDRYVDGDSTRFSAAVDVQVQLDGGGGFTFTLFPDFNLNVQFPQNAPSYRTLYRIPAFDQQTGWTANDNALYTISVHQNALPDPRMHDAAGNDLPIATLGSFRITVGTPDAVAPSAQLTAPAILVPGGATHDFAIEYRDNVALDPATIGAGDVRVTGPGGFNQLASFVSISPALTTGSKRIATYRITAPGGAWQHTHDGNYTISAEPNQVRDTSNNALAGGALGTLLVHIPLPGDANGDDRVNVNDFTILAGNFGRAGRGYPTGDFNFDGLVNVNDFTILAGRFGTSLAPVTRLPFAKTGLIGGKGAETSELQKLLA